MELGFARQAKYREKTLECLGKLGLCYFILVTISIFITLLSVAIPVVYEGSPWSIATRTALSCYMIVCIYLNYFLMIRKHSYYISNTSSLLFRGLEYLPDPSWRRCIDCDTNVPPRTHHCSLCRRCIIKRDHHCFFTGTCIGNI